jgi:hypothetical protein
VGNPSIETIVQDGFAEDLRDVLLEWLDAGDSRMSSRIQPQG